MLATLLFLSLLAAPQAPAPAGQVPTIVDATALANQGLFDAALDAFRRIAAANPRNYEARIWIARLHGWMGHPELAAPVYRSVMLEDPSNLDAIVGAGMTLVALGETDEGIELLERAESMRPQNAEVLGGLGRAHTLAGHTTRALLYAERAASVDPSAVNRLTLEQARMIHGHRVEVNSFGESYNTSVEETGSADVRVNFRLREDLRLTGRGQHQRKFGYSEQRGGGGLEWRWRQRTSLFGQVLIGPEDNAVLPRVDVNGEVAHTDGATQWVAGYRFFDFPSAQVSVISPGVTVWPNDRVSLGARYYLSLTDRPTLTDSQTGHSLALRAAYRTVPRVWIHAGYTAGTDSFDTLSPDRVGDFRANTVSGGLRMDLRSLTSVLGVYEHQWRQNSIRMQRLSISLLQRF
jgi:YaiO family outer membrane protein